MQHVRVRAVDILIVMFSAVTHDWVVGMVGMVEWLVWWERREGWLGMRTDFHAC
jgi:hypothetical protein